MGPEKELVGSSSSSSSFMTIKSIAFELIEHIKSIVEIYAKISDLNTRGNWNLN